MKNFTHMNYLSSKELLSLSDVPNVSLQALKCTLIFG